MFASTKALCLQRNLYGLLAISTVCNASHASSAGLTKLSKTLAAQWLQSLIQFDAGPDLPKWSTERFLRRRAIVEMARVCLAIGATETQSKFFSHALSLTDKYDLRDDHVAALETLEPYLGTQSDMTSITPWVTDLRSRLQSIVGNPPAAPKDFRRNANIDCKCSDCAKITTFLIDRVASVLELPLPEKRRRHLHQQIDGKRLDLTHQTRRRGSPYVLVCTKNTASFERAVVVHKEDLKRLAFVELILQAKRPN